MKFKYKQFVLGCVVGSMMVSGVALASSDVINNVLKGTSKFIINQVDKTPSGNIFNNGKINVPSSLVYEGTTYIPIRMVSNMLGIPIEWDGKNKAVLVGNSVYTGKYLTELAPSELDNEVKVNKNITIDSQSYNKSLNITTGVERSITYNLNGQYDELTFVYAGGDYKYNGTLKITNENGQVIFESGVPTNSLGYEAKVDLNGALNITISYKGINNGTSQLLLANPLLK